jgi:hypothetical protein
MSVVLLHAHYDIIAATVRVLGFTDCNAHGLALIVAVANNTSLLIHHIPAILSLIPTNVISVVGTGFFVGPSH